MWTATDALLDMVLEDVTEQYVPAWPPSLAAANYLVVTTPAPKQSYRRFYSTATTSAWYEEMLGRFVDLLTGRS